MPRETTPSHLACDECRVRKFKCSKDRPTCILCLQQGKECIYSHRVERTPLTRVNLTNAEERIRKLEAAFTQLLPSVDLNSILNATPNDGPITPDLVAAAKPEAVPSPSWINLRESASPGPEEALPQQADGFDWAEETTLGGLSDGMAALSIKPEGTGYLGATSSVMPLRALLKGDIGFGAYSQPSSIGSSNAPNAYQAPKPINSLSHLSEHVFINAYFVHYHTTYPFLHEPTFRAQYSGQLPRPKGHAWPILLNTVLALGAWSLGDDNSNMDDVFYNEVNRLSQDASVFEVGNLALVQALLLLSNYTQKRNKPNTGWNYLGLAVRMALSLGLHKEFPEWKISLLEREMRRRVWWGVYIFDSGASITFGRPVLLPENSIMDANHVLNIHEENLTLTTRSLPSELPSPTIYSSLHAQSLFHQTTNPLYHRLISTPPPTPQELLDLQKPIDAWQDSIPSYFQISNLDLHNHEALIFARYRLSWRAWNLRIILFRPIVLRWAARAWSRGSSETTETDGKEEEQCRLLCLESARDTIASIAEYTSRNIASRLGNWYILYFLFQAGLLPLIHLITLPMSPSAHLWLADLRTTKDLLSYAAISNALAGRCLEVIDRLYAPLLEATEQEAMLQGPRLFWEVQNLFTGDGGNGVGDGMDFMDWGTFEGGWDKGPGF